MLDIYNKPCGFSDELYFGLLLKRGRTIKEFKQIINTIKPSEFVIDNTSIKPINIRSKYIYAEHRQNSGSVYSNISIEPGKLNLHYISKQKEQEDISRPFYLPTISFNDKPLSNIYSIPSVYTDWRFFNLNPFNIFRSFKYNNLNINNLLINNNNDTINTLLNLNAHDESFNSLNLNQVAYWAHPLEYNTIPLYSFINGYNILEYFFKNGRDNQLLYLIGLYENSLNNVKNLSTISIQKYKFITTPQSLTRLIGTFITDDVLNSARMSGSLFIRKCEKGSNIHKYADQLYKTRTKYIY